METYYGGCHCGQVAFSVTTDLSKVVVCNCSICSKKRAWHHRVNPEQFQLLKGQEALSLYQFGTNTAKHFFCKYCGIHPFSRPRSNPDLICVNVKCLNNVDSELESAEKVMFDGQNWEQSADFLNAKLSSDMERVKDKRRGIAVTHINLGFIIIVNTFYGVASFELYLLSYSVNFTTMSISAFFYAAECPYNRRIFGKKKETLHAKNHSLAVPDAGQPNWIGQFKFKKCHSQTHC